MAWTGSSIHETYFMQEIDAGHNGRNLTNNVPIGKNHQLLKSQSSILRQNRKENRLHALKLMVVKFFQFCNLITVRLSEIKGTSPMFS